MRKPIAIGRKNRLFGGSERGGRSAASAYTLIETATLSGVDPQAWLIDVFGRIADHRVTRLDELMPRGYAQVVSVTETGSDRQSSQAGRTRSPPLN